MLFNSKRRGFTLIELVISIAIVGILSIVTFGNFAGQADKNAVKLAANQIAADLQKQYTSAQSGRQISGVTPSGYGLYFGSVSSSTSYTLYADLSSSSSVGYQNYDTEDVTTGQIRTLPKNTFVNAIENDNSGSWGSVVMPPSFQYSLPGANLTVIPYPRPPVTTTVIIRVKHTTKEICGYITITPNIGAINITPLTHC